MFFDAGETLLHPHPSFPELLSPTVCAPRARRSPGAHPRRRCTRARETVPGAAAEGEVWSTSEAGRARSGGPCTASLLAGRARRVPGDDRLAGRLYATFTDLGELPAVPRRAPDPGDAPRRRADRWGWCRTSRRGWSGCSSTSGDPDLLEVRVISGVEGDGEARPGDLPDGAGPGRRSAGRVGLRRATTCSSTWSPRPPSGCSGSSSTAATATPGFAGDRISVAARPARRPGARVVSRASDAFTVEEAEALLPWLGELLPRIRAARQVVLAGAQRIRRTAQGNGAVAGEQARGYRDALSELRRDVEAITDGASILRDPETGLVDFPTARDGRRGLPVLADGRGAGSRSGTGPSRGSPGAGRCEPGPPGRRSTGTGVACESRCLRTPSSSMTSASRTGTCEAVRGIDLVVEEGEVFALLGPNGAGKTTTVEILEGFRRRDAGEVRVLGYDPGAPRSRAPRAASASCCSPPASTRSSPSRRPSTCTAATTRTRGPWTR